MGDAATSAAAPHLAGSDRFHRKVVIITGGGSGIGAATARRFHAEGAAVVLAGRTRSKLDEVAAMLDVDRSLSVVADVSSADDCTVLVKAAIERFGRIDTLVNNAGTGWEVEPDRDHLHHWEATPTPSLDGNTSPAGPPQPRRS